MNSSSKVSVAEVRAVTVEVIANATMGGHRMTLKQIHEAIGGDEVTPEKRMYAIISFLMNRGDVERIQPENPAAMFEYQVTQEYLKKHSKTTKSIPSVVEGSGPRVIRWGGKIRMQVAVEVKRLRSECPHIPLTDAVVKAEEILDPKQRKGLQRREDLMWLDELVRSLPEPVKAIAPVIAKVFVEAPEVFLNGVSCTEAAHFMTAVVRKMILTGVFQEVAHTMGGEPMETFARSVEEPPVDRRHDPRMPKSAEAAVRKPSILIIGLIPKQIAEVKHKYDRFFDLRFHEANEAMTMLRSRAEKVGEVILMKDWVDHAHRDVLIKANIDFKVVSGSNSSLFGVLNAMAHEAVEMA
jgi:hypothetical protein